MREVRNNIRQDWLSIPRRREEERLDPHVYARGINGLTVEEAVRRAWARVICNPASGGGTCDPDQLRKNLSDFDLDWIDTESPEDATEAAREWSDGLLIAAGGDGTVNDVINGIGMAGFPEGVTLALLPTGTGNDFAATLAIPEQFDEAEAVIRQNRVRTLDVVR